MLNGRRLPFKLAHISLALAGLMWVFPFLDYYHSYPLTTFYQEWSAALLGLAALALLATREYWQRAEVPRIVLLPVVMLLLVLLQLALGKLPYAGQTLLYTLYLMWAALLVMLGARLREELGLPAMATALAVFLLLGAELSAAIGVLQHFGWRSFLDHVITMRVSAAVYGNIAQPNHYADYLTLGLASLGLLHARGSLRAWQAALLALPILFVMPLSGSREAWFYLSWLVLAAFLWQRREKAARPLLHYSLLVLLGFALMHLAIELPWLAGPSASVNSVQRLFAEDVYSGGIRLYLWREAWLMFAQFPIFGAGFGQFAWQHFQLAPVLRDVQISGLYNNAHNLLMQLAAEGGLAGLLALFGTLLPWLWRQRGERSIYQWWGCAVLAILAIHSMLEYPLWYAYFIGIAALLLGALDASRYRIEMHAAGRIFVLLVLLLGVLSLRQLLIGYRGMEGLFALHPQSGGKTAYLERLHSDLAALQQQALLQPYGSLFSATLLDAAPENLAAKLEHNGNAMRFIPIPVVVYRQALLLAQNGEQAAAETQIERAIWAYPAEFHSTETELRALAAKDPARFAALLEFALRKNEEYQRELHAVRAK